MMKHPDSPSPEPSRRRSESERAVRPRAGRIPDPESAPSIKPDKAGVGVLLNELLADEFVVYVKTLNYHWNLRGMQFHSLHPFLEKIYQEQFEAVDDLAERVRTVGGIALGSMDELLRNARLKEQTGFPPDPRAMISNLLLDYESILVSLRTGIAETAGPFDDPGTCNFLTGLLERQEKTAWMLRTHLDKDLG
ncbi:MAG: DNA starvation/stationary phase protection protein [Planctomycetaceae bacterium]|nr:DNA starvation/stationary phase protection protein [Planctomycetaceae bacterium]